MKEALLLIFNVSLPALLDKRRVFEDAARREAAESQ